MKPSKGAWVAAVGVTVGMGSLVAIALSGFGVVKFNHIETNVVGACFIVGLVLFVGGFLTIDLSKLPTK